MFTYVKKCKNAKKLYAFWIFQHFVLINYFENFPLFPKEKFEDLTVEKMQCKNLLKMVLNAGISAASKN